jgi:aspartyl/asparaginyl beta-hydroxylase (cupin superfamily)
MKIYLILIILIFFLIYYKNNMLDYCFYNPNLFNELNKIDKYDDAIITECLNLIPDKKIWIDWPEKKLYKKKNNWKIFPLFAFGTWSINNCKEVPVLTKYLKSIKGLKVALLTKLAPNTCLKPHKGWGKYSNNILRCHYGIKIPENCYVAVKNDDDTKYKKIYHKYKKWIVFDDSKLHYANNKSSQERLVLIIDIERPDFIKPGTSTIEYSEELINMVNEFKKSQINM